MVEAGRVTAIIDGDIGPLKTALNEAKGHASSAASGIENDFKKGFGSGLQSSVSGLTSSMGPLGSAISGVSGGLGLAATGALAGVAALGALGTAAVSTAADWQSLMAGVSKTTGVEGSGLDQLSADLQRIRTETGATAADIANATITAGSVGIPKEELAGFTEVALQMGSAFSMSSEAAVSGISAIGNSAKEAGTSWTEFGTRAGSSVNVLADSMRTSEEQILTGMTHLGATMGLLKPPQDTIPAWMALVATVQSLGLVGDQAGEAVQDALTYAAKNASSKELGIDVAGLLGTSETQLQLDLRSNAPEVLQDVAKAIAALPLEQQADAMAMFGSTGSKAIALLMGDLDTTTGSFSKLGTAIDDSNKAWEEGTSLSTAYGKSQDTFNVATSRLTASLDVAGQKLGTVFLPALTSVVDALTTGVNAAVSFGEAIGGAFSDTADAIVAGGQEASTWLSDITGGALGVDEMSSPEMKARIKAMGTDSAKTMADGIKENKDLQKSPGNALSSNESVDAVKDAAKKLADAFATEQEGYIKSHSSGGYSLATMMMLAGQDGTGDLSDRMLGQVEIGGGFFTRVNYDINDNFTGYRLTTPTGSYEYSSYQDFVSSAPKDLEEYVGRALTELEKAEFLGDAQKVVQLKASAEVEVDTYLDFAENLKNEMTEAGEEINEAFLEGLTPDAASIESRLESIRNLKLYDPEEAKRQGADNAIAYLEALKDSLDSYESAKVKFLAEPDNEQARIAFEATLSNLQQVASENPLKIKAELDLTEFNTEKAKPFDFSEWVKSPNLADILNLKTFAEDTFQPMVLSESADALSALNTSVSNGLKPAQDLIAEYKALAAITPLLFDSAQTAALNAYNGTAESAARTLEALSEKVEKTAEKAKDATVGYDNLKKAIEGCSECAVSEFEPWQEAQDGLFQDSYIGQGGEAYLKWKKGQNAAIAETQAAMAAMGGIVTDVKMKVSLDRTEADKTIAEVETLAQKERTMPLLIDDSAAMASIASIDAAASRPVTKIVYVQEVGGSSSSSNDGLDYFNGDWIPQFGAGDAFVTSPTLAIVGDRPGGEWIGGLDQAEDRFGGSGSGSPTVIIDNSDALPCLMNTEENTQETTTRLGSVDDNVCKLESAIQNMGSNIVSAFASVSGAWGGNGGTGGRYGSFFGGSSWLSGGAAGVGAGWDVEPSWGGENASLNTQYRNQMDYSNWSQPMLDANPGWELPPIFMANEAYVASPTLAVVGDRPGGEYVIGAARFEAAAGKMRSGGITVNLTQNINGSGLSTSELEDVLARNNKALIAEITDAAGGL